MKIIEGLVTPEVYLETQKNITKWLEELLIHSRRIRKNMVDLKLQRKERLRESNNSGSSHSGKTYDLVTRSWS